jgi:hypothetical protein
MAEVEAPTQEVKLFGRWSFDDVQVSPLLLPFPSAPLLLYPNLIGVLRAETL